MQGPRFSPQQKTAIAQAVMSRPVRIELPFFYRPRVRKQSAWSFIVRAVTLRKQREAERLAA